MSNVWRICVIEGDTSLNQNLVSALRKDGYTVQGVMSSTDAMRLLWSEEYDVVIYSLNSQGANGLELLRWLRAYRSSVRPIVLGSAGDNQQRLQALEGGAVSYLEKPVDLRILRDELRRLLQQTGFTASLDSFDLLDVIQIITMSRKSITLHIDTGLEERGMLRFHNGDLIWAEYGTLRGEEAFFALAAHKNGTVTQQISEGQSATNVTQPLSRLIFQALQYRTKYANNQQPVEQGPLGTGRAPALQSNTAGNISPSGPLLSDDIDDTPFVFATDGTPVSSPQLPPVTHTAPAFSAPQEPVPSRTQSEPPVMEQHKEWWEIAGQTSGVAEGTHSIGNEVDSVPTSAMDGRVLRDAMPSPRARPLQGETSSFKKNSSQQSSWLTEQPTSGRVPARSSTPLPAPAQVPTPPKPSSVSGETRQIQAGKVPFKTTDELLKTQQSSPYMSTVPSEVGEQQPSSPQWLQEVQKLSSSPQWPQEPQRPSSSLQHNLTGQSGAFERTPGRQNPPGMTGANPVQAPDTSRKSNPSESSTPPRVTRQLTSKNYAALVSALQTLGYSLPGFIAAAVVDVDNTAIAQVVIDDTDTSQIWQLLSIVQRSALSALQSAEWGRYEETIMTTASRHVLIRAIGDDEKVFLVLITTRGTSFTDSLEIMANVEGPISAVLR